MEEATPARKRQGWLQTDKKRRPSALKTNTIQREILSLKTLRARYAIIYKLLPLFIYSYYSGSINYEYFLSILDWLLFFSMQFLAINLRFSMLRFMESVFWACTFFAFFLFDLYNNQLITDPRFFLSSFIQREFSLFFSFLA